MTTTAPTPAPPTAPQRATVPSHPLPPSSSGDRSWRTVLLLIAAAMVVLTLGGMVTGSILAARSWGSYTDVPATQSFGRPDRLAVTSDLGDVTVRTSTDVDEVTLRLYDSSPGASTAADGTARARVTTAHGADGTTIDVSQPGSIGLGPWDDATDSLELTVPADLAATMDLTVSADVGDLAVTGSYGTLAVHDSTGDVQLPGVATTGSLQVSSDIGDVRVLLDEGAAPQRIEVTADTGDVHVSVPGDTPYLVDASADLGEVRVDPGLSLPGAAPLTARSDIGDVTVTR